MWAFCFSWRPKGAMHDGYGRFDWSWLRLRNVWDTQTITCRYRHTTVSWARDFYGRKCPKQSLVRTCGQVSKSGLYVIRWRQIELDEQGWIPETVRFISACCFSTKRLPWLGTCFLPYMTANVWLVRVDLLLAGKKRNDTERMVTSCTKHNVTRTVSVLEHVSRDVSSQLSHWPSLLARVSMLISVCMASRVCPTARFHSFDTENGVFVWVFVTRFLDWFTLDQLYPI